MSGPSPPDGGLLHESLLSLVQRTSAVIPKDVRDVIARSAAAEEEGSEAAFALQTIARNIELAEERGLPICQDTGTLIFTVRHPRDLDVAGFEQAVCDAVVDATARGYLRQNSVHSLTGKNSGNNLGPGSPVFHFVPEDRDDLDVRLILKGGGCENVGTQYALPNRALGAGRDLEGVRRVVLDAVYKAQGKGCAPGVLGVCIGGDRGTGFVHSKEQLLRTLDDTNVEPALAELEERIVREANTLGIGPMGFGGGTTLLGCKIGHQNRLPASYFVSISYMCWAYRRQGIRMTRAGEVLEWLY